MNRQVLVVIALAVVVLVGLSGCHTAGAGTELPAGLNINVSGQQEGIWVNGTGKMTVTPDMAVVSLGIVARQPTVAEAQSQAAEAMHGVITVLRDMGVAEKDIQTRQYSIQQMTTWDRYGERDTVTGYRVTNMVTVNIREIDRTGAIIDAVAMTGGDLTRVQHIRFTVDDPSAFQEAAREKALADAKAKAEQMAKLTGVTLGKPTYISDNAFMPHVYYSMDAREAAYGIETPISPGEMDITVTVQVAYAIR